MKHELSQTVVSAAQSPKTAAAVSTVVTTAGLGSAVLNLVPGAMGLIAMGLGISLQLVLRRKGALESKKLELEISILEKKESGH